VLDINPDMIEKLNVLANMVQGMSEDEALQEFNKVCAEREIGDLIANMDCQVDVEEGPLEGTWNRGLMTLDIPSDLTNSNM